MNILQTFSLASIRKEMIITFCKLFSRIFQKNFFFEVEVAGYRWIWKEDEKETLGERNKKRTTIIGV